MYHSCFIFFAMLGYEGIEVPGVAFDVLKKDESTLDSRFAVIYWFLSYSRKS